MNALRLVQAACRFFLSLDGLLDFLEGARLDLADARRAVYFAEAISIITEKRRVSVPNRLDDWWTGKTAQAAGDAGCKYDGATMRR